MASSMLALKPYLIASLPPDQIATVRGLEPLLWLIIVFAPIGQLVKGLLLAVIGWAVLALADVRRRVRPTLSILLYGEALLAANGVLLALFLNLTSGTGAGSPMPVGGLSLAAFVSPQDNSLLGAIAQNLTVMHLAWFVFVYMALRRVVALQRLAAASVVSLLWGATSTFAVIRSFILL